MKSLITRTGVAALLVAIIIGALSIAPPEKIRAEEEGSFFDEIDRATDEFGDGLNEAGEEFHETTEGAGEAADSFADESAEKTTEAIEEGNKTFWQAMWDWFGKSFLIMLVVGLLFWSIVIGLVVWLIIYLVRKSKKNSNQ